jgi:DNA-binding transcriptional MerR regulator
MEVATPVRTYSITELAQEFAVTPRTIRFYEDRGLMKPQRQGQVRIYREGDRARLDLILRGKRLGFSLDEISELLALYQRRDRGLEQTLRTIDRLKERIAALESQRLDIDAALSELTDVHQALCVRVRDLQNAPSDQIAADAAQ